MRQLRIEQGPQNVVCVHLTLVPYIAAAGELKTKPTQHSVQKLREIGIQPDVLICRCDRPLEAKLKKKIALFSNVAGRRRVHLAGRADDLRGAAAPPRRGARRQDLRAAQHLVARAQPRGLAARRREGQVAQVAGASSASSASTSSSPRRYKSLNEALTHGGIANDCKVIIRYIDSEEVERDGAEKLCEDVDGILVAPAASARAAPRARSPPSATRASSQVPFFGICLGMQLAVIEYARNVCGLAGANSIEIDPTPQVPGGRR